MWRIQLRIPGVLGEPDVVPQWREGVAVELHAGVDAVVGGPIRRQAARIIRVNLVKGEVSSRSLGGSSRGTTQASIVESHTHCPVGCDRQVGLELIDWRF